MYGAPVSGLVPESSTWTMCWVSIEPATRASRWKRATLSGEGAAPSSSITLMATLRCVPACCASYTAPIPPLPRMRLIS